MFQGGDEVSKTLWVGSVPTAPANLKYLLFGSQGRLVELGLSRLFAKQVEVKLSRVQILHLPPFFTFVFKKVIIQRGGVMLG